MGKLKNTTIPDYDQHSHNPLDVARGTMDDLGVTFIWLNDPTDMGVLNFDTFDEVLTYVSGRIDTFNITVQQGHQKRHFTIWEMPWAGGDLDG
jgi:hypothetical protein